MTRSPRGCSATATNMATTGPTSSTCLRCIRRLGDLGRYGADGAIGVLVDELHEARSGSFRGFAKRCVIEPPQNMECVGRRNEALEGHEERDLHRCLVGPRDTWVERAHDE